MGIVNIDINELPDEKDIDKIIEAIGIISLYKYEDNKALYHNDLKIAVYGNYMKVVEGVGELLKGLGK